MPVPGGLRTVKPRRMHSSHATTAFLLLCMVGYSACDSNWLLQCGIPAKKDSQSGGAGRYTHGTLHGMLFACYTDFGHESVPQSIGCLTYRPGSVDCRNRCMGPIELGDNWICLSRSFRQVCRDHEAGFRPSDTRCKHNIPRRQ